MTVQADHVAGGPADAPGRHRRHLLFLTKYGRRAASTRFRFWQFFDPLEAAGFSCEISPLLDDRYLDAKLDRGRLHLGAVAVGLTRRLLELRRVRKFDGVVLYMEALPYLPPFFERLMQTLGVAYACDLDDACFHNYDLSPRAWVRRILGQKIGQVLRGARVVTAGNAYLAAYARRFNSSVQVIPTVVDTTKFRPPHQRAARSEVVVGWIGSPSTATYLQELADVWPRAIPPGKARLELVGSGPIGLGPTPVSIRPWRESEEIAAIQAFDIGVMPLRDDPWARGKCGFKLVEYMACGLPVVASAVGVNATIVDHGRNGLLCTTAAEWVDGLHRLIDDAALRAEWGRRARESAVEHWSLARWAPAQVAQMQRLVATKEGA